MKKSIFLKSGIAIAAVVLCSAGFLKSSSTSVNANKQASVKLRDLYRISNANAEGSSGCTKGGSPCTVTYNGTPGYTIEGYKN
jgi:hypothetical protein